MINDAFEKMTVLQNDYVEIKSSYNFIEEDDHVETIQQFFIQDWKW